MIQDSSAFGQPIMPKYYTIASGESVVYLKSMFMTEIENLECRDPYFKESVYNCTYIIVASTRYY